MFINNKVIYSLLNVLFERGVCDDQDYSEVDYLKSKIQNDLVNILNYIVLERRVFASVAYYFLINES